MQPVLLIVLRCLLKYTTAAFAQRRRWRRADVGRGGPSSDLHLRAVDQDLQRVSRSMFHVWAWPKFTR
jgi:hypothetical protein